ncbi:MAG: amidase, partial [Myxococcales bacterium]|nr:amidase [Myxococcales bacterium]
AACDAAVAKLEARGARVVPIEIPELALLRTAHLVTITSEMHAALQRHFKHHRGALGLDTRLNLALAGRLLAADYAQAQRVRQAFFDRFLDLFQACDVVLTPTTGRTAPVIHPGALKAGESNLAVTEQIMRFAPIGNLVGLPALSVPCGYDDEGLPVGLQIMGPAWSEGRLLRVGAAVEADAPGHAPSVHHRLLPQP